MSAKDGFENKILTHLFQNSTIPNIGDASGLQPSSTEGHFWVALFTVTPSDSASGNECDYAGYARVAVPRNASGWAVSGNVVSNASALAFPQCVSGNADVAVAFQIHYASSLYVDDAFLWGPLSSDLSISASVTPEFAIGDLSINVD
jgi:hypothetical protein